MARLAARPKPPAEAPPSEVHKDAAGLLRENGYKVQIIRAVTPDAIVYENHMAVLRTAWLKRSDDKLKVIVEDGFQTFAPWER